MPVHAILTNLFESIKTWTETLIYLEIGIIAGMYSCLCLWWFCLQAYSLFILFIL